MSILRCIECNNTYDDNQVIYSCQKCGDLLEVIYDYDKIINQPNFDNWKNLPLSVWRYHNFLPIKTEEKISLNEGGTGLHNTSKLAAFLGIEKLFIKNEGENPTGSFKDRGMTIAVSKARNLGSSVIICASTGNTSASLAAYGARGGMKRIVLIPSGKVAYGKLSQAMMCGAQVLQIRGNFDESLDMVMQISSRFKNIYLVNSINPFRIEGQKTLGFEIVEQLGDVPDWIIMPVGNAGNISAVWKGLNEFKQLGYINKLPKMVGVQAAGSSPIVDAFLKHEMKIENVKKPDTVATAIRIGAPVSWKKALRSIYDSGGTSLKVSDKDILDSQINLARLEGLFVEPASASPIAALKKLIANGTIQRDESVVCVATGHGLKDPEVMNNIFEKPIELDANIEKITTALNPDDTKLDVDELNPVITHKSNSLNNEE